MKNEIISPKQYVSLQQFKNQIVTKISSKIKNESSI